MASINQTGAGIRLPNFCNMGVALRTLLVGNLFVLAIALARAPSLAGLPGELTLAAAFAEPILIASLAALCAARRWLHSIGYVPALAAIALFEVAAAMGVHSLGGELLRDARAASFGTVALLTLFVTAGVLAYFDLRARALAPSIAEARIQALQARIRPHFLYNSINAVLSLMRSDPRRAERALEDLADLFRVLMAENRTLAPIAAEVELARQYLALESIRLGDRLRVQWKVDTMPADALVPPLVLQPLVENAVYHGIEPSEAGGEIEIDVALAGDRLVMRLSNPVAPNSRHASGNRMAIMNIRERLQLHFDAEASMKSEVVDGSYQVTIQVPYITKAA